MVRKALAEHPSTIDPRKYLSPAREEMTRLYARKNREVLGSAGKA
jgi:fructose-bisphosphate aldolase class II